MCAHKPCFLMPGHICAFSVIQWNYINKISINYLMIMQILKPTINNSGFHYKSIEDNVVLDIVFFIRVLYVIFWKVSQWTWTLVDTWRNSTNSTVHTKWNFKTTFIIISIWKRSTACNASCQLVRFWKVRQLFCKVKQNFILQK